MQLDWNSIQFEINFDRRVCLTKYTIKKIKQICMKMAKTIVWEHKPIVRRIVHQLFTMLSLKNRERSSSKSRIRWHQMRHIHDVNMCTYLQGEKCIFTKDQCIYTVAHHLCASLFSCLIFDTRMIVEVSKIKKKNI